MKTLTEKVMLENQKKIKDEFMILQICQHRYVIKQLDNFTNNDDQLNIVMEFANAGDL